MRHMTVVQYCTEVPLFHSQKECFISKIHVSVTGVMSVYGGGTFSDENFNLKHNAPGLLSMVTGRQAE